MFFFCFFSPSFCYIHSLSRKYDASPPAMTPLSPHPRIGQSTPFGPAHSDSVIHPPQRRGLVESPRGGEGTTELTGSSARLQSRQGEDGAAHRHRGLQHLVSYWLLQGEQRSQTESGPVYYTPVNPWLRGKWGKEKGKWRWFHPSGR